MAVHLIDTGDFVDSSIWLLKSDKGLLIDTGYGSHTDFISSEISRILGETKLEAIVLTHCHFDHIGGATKLSSDFHCPIYIGKNDLESATNANERTAGFMSPVPVKPVKCEPLSEGDVFDIGDYRLKVIDTPGHTQGGISLYDEKTHSLFSGDTLFSNGFGRIDLPGGSFSAIKNSLLKLSNLNITTLYPGHGNAFPNGKISLMETIQRMNYL